MVFADFMEKIWRYQQNGLSLRPIITHYKLQIRMLGIFNNSWCRMAWTMLCVILGGLTAGAETFYTHPLVDEVRTLQTLVDGDFRRLPVIDGSKNSRVEISFDYLADEEQYLQYTVIHCDADWQQDDLSELDYVDGFLPTRLTRVAPSFNTYVNYYHYSLSFPNPDVQLLVSGNYAVMVHPENEPDEPIAVACFSVSEQKAFVGGEVSGNTDIDFRQEHQQLTLQCSWSQQQLPYLNPAGELRMMVTQNRRPSSRREVKAPSRIEAGKAYFEHLRELIFEAGNTFRYFEFTDYRYATLGVERVRYYAPYYHAELVTDQSRAGSFYRYEQDVHGRYKVHALRVEDPNTEGEYFWADFTLSGAMPPKGRGSIFLSGDFTYGELTDEFRMEYDPERQCYTGHVLLKQGHYNYQYVVGPEWVPDFEEKIPAITTNTVEGAYYEAHNQYEVYVYYRPAGGRYDRLLGVAIIE